MKVWSTRIKALSPITGVMTVYCGPNVEAPTKKLAREYCENNGLGYCHIGDEIDTEVITYADGSSTVIDYYKTQNN